MHSPKLLTFAVAAALSLVGTVATAQDLPAPVDQPYPGKLALDVDMSSAPLHIFRVHERIPVQAGQVVLNYPKWIPGDHSPDGPIHDIAGLIITANGKQIPWRRDLVEMYAIHVTVPQGVSTLDVSFQFLSPESGIDMAATSALAVLEFNSVAFYPAGYYVRQITIEPSVTLPSGWKFASAMDVASRNGDTIQFKPVSFNKLVDSPLIASRYFNRIDLNPGAKAPVFIDIVGDAPKDLHLSEQQIDGLHNVVVQANKLFGSHHYDHYDFLAILSDRIRHFGLEHHQSSDNRLPADLFQDASGNLVLEDLMPHEFVHSWNGKFRRPADLWTPTFMEPMKGDLLWVYEGLTEYWATVLTTRAGIWTPEQYRDELAGIAATMANRTGRTWRSLQDTADAAQLLYSSPSDWVNYRRSTDFYPEGVLLWLDVDTKIRTLSNGKRSLDDFAKVFYSMDDGSFVTNTYSYQDVLAALNKVQPYDWNTFLRQRLDATGTDLPEHGIEQGGWSLTYDDTPSAYDRSLEKIHPGTNLSSSLGISVKSNGVIADVQWDGVAAKAGLVPGFRIVAVNRLNFTPDVLKDAIKAAHGNKAPIALLIDDSGEFRTVNVSYDGGLRYAHLVRGNGKDLLDAIASPLK